MLDKIKENMNGAKLRAILLLEADFNGMNTIIYNSRVFPSLEACRTISYEVIVGRSGESSQHVTLNKKLVHDIAHQIMRPTVVISACSTNCYDRIAHPVTIMTNKNLAVQL